MKGFHGHRHGRRSHHAATAAKLVVCASALALLTIGACFPSLSKIHLGECINGCNADSRACLGTGGEGGTGGASSCPVATACFDSVQACSDDATECSKTCAHGDTECLSACSDKANTCIHQIRGCVDDVQTCARAQENSGKACLTDLVGCVAQCASDAEAVIRGKK